MKFVGAVYPNLDRSPHRRYFMECMLNGFCFPQENVFRFRAHDGEDYDDSESLCEAAIADGFDGFYLLLDTWMTKRDLAVQWTWFTGFRLVSDLLDDDECVLYTLDDFMVRRFFDDFCGLVGRLDDLKIIQIFDWNPDDEPDHGLADEDLYKPCNFTKCRVSPELYHGFNGPGDSVMILSKAGAKLLLGWMQTFPYDFPEVHVLRHGRDVEPGCYSTVDWQDWLCLIDVSISGSYRRGVASEFSIM